MASLSSKTNIRYSFIVQFSEYLLTADQSQKLPVILNEGHSQQILGILELNVFVVIKSILRKLCRFFIKELIEVRHDAVEVIGFTDEELEEILSYLCVS